MSHSASPLAAFHLIGDRSRLHREEAGLPGLQPALFSQYHDLSRLRHDYPVVLINPPASVGWIKSLTDITDELLQKIAPPGTEGEETRRQVLYLEQTIRDWLASGQKGSLSALWEAASEQLTSADGAGDALAANLQRARDALSVDGELTGCEDHLATKLITRAWHESEEQKAEYLRYRIVRLTQKLKDILTVNYMHSSDAREAGKLESTMGTANQSVFDFDAMARVLRTAPAAEPLPQQRQERIEAAIEVLQSQQFIALPTQGAQAVNPTFRFAFTDPEEAVAAYHERLPHMAALVRAISVARLEIDNRYEPSRHDAFFEYFDEHRLGPADLALFPSYLLCVDELDEAALNSLLKILRTGLPFKIVAQTSDILENDSIDGVRLTFGTRGQHLARMAAGLDRVFVLQAASSALYRLSNAVYRGLAIDEPALFSVFSGETREEQSKDTSPSGYLVGAAAVESRVFPGFTYDPAAGPGQADRYDIHSNPSAELDWPVHELPFENADHNRQLERIAFTPVDFIAADPRFTERFACVPREDWDDDMIPVHEFLALNHEQRSSKVPFVLLADQEGVLHRAVFDNHLVDAADRCLDSWRCLQELGGVNNSHARRALNEAELKWAAEKAELATHAAKAAVAPAGTQSTDDVQPSASSAAAVGAAPAAEEAPPPASDDPWIETIRCTTCNECTQINDRMFSYNEDKRAYVADPDAGTFRELVEAAETCQVAIIHPGKPRNPDEPGLEELIARAEPFNT